MTKDTIFKNQQDTIEAFTFDHNVANVFDDMIVRSVPFYQEIQNATIALTKSLLQNTKTTIYDIGCSTGTTILGLASELSESEITYIGIDNSPAMIDVANQKLESSSISDQQKNNITFVVSDMFTHDYDNASIVILNYTLQFSPPEKRKVLLSKIYQSLIPNGALVMTEKVAAKNEILENLITEMYYSFKKLNGYSELEISQKRTALENVLIPLSLEDNLQLLKQAGFTEIELFLKWYAFSSFLAIKNNL